MEYVQCIPLRCAAAAAAADGRRLYTHNWLLRRGSCNQKCSAAGDIEETRTKPRRLKKKKKKKTVGSTSQGGFQFVVDHHPTEF